MAMLNNFWSGFASGVRNTPRQYFAPLTAIAFSFSRPGGYIRHLKALYRGRK